MVGLSLLTALLGVFVLSGVVKESDAAMVTRCRNHPGWPQYYVADDRDRCVFYMCAAGGRRMDCAPGSGLPRDYVIGIENPCTERVAGCFKKAHVHTHRPVYPHHPHHPKTKTKTYPARATTPTTTPTTTTPTTTTATTTSEDPTTTQPSPTPTFSSVGNGNGIVTPIANGATACPSLPPSRPILETFSGRHALGGRVDQTINSINECYSLCSTRSTTCFGFDWNITARACWIHNRNTECTPLLAAEGVFHYRLAPCGARLTRDVHISGGTYRPDVSTLDGCVASCCEPCKGLDFDEEEKTCWHHGADTECNPLIPKAGCSHIRLRAVDCEARLGNEQTTRVVVEGRTISPTGSPAVVPPETPSNTIPPTQRPAPSATTPTTLQTRTPSEPSRRPPIPEGYVQMYSQQCLPTDRFLFTFQDTAGNRVVPSEDDCLRACLERNSCFGIDFDTSEQTCYVHSRTSICNNLVQDRTCNHYSRVACGLPRGEAASAFLAIFEESHVLMGSQLNATFTKEGCQLRCINDDECQGVDYNKVDETCWKHTVEDECALPTPKPACTHYRKMAC